MKKHASAAKRSVSALVQGIVFPIRINKYLAACGYCTRRGGDELVAKGVVFVNGVKATLGQMVDETDRVELHRKGKAPHFTYLLCHKPVGLSTLRMKDEESDVRDLIDPVYRSLKLFPVGRLDKATSGLMILTDDARITDRLLNPKHAHSKVYEVHTKLPLRASFQEKMEQYVSDDDSGAVSCQVDVTGEKSFRITVHEGRTQQVRHMVASLFNEVISLKRIGITGLTLGSLKVGACRPMTDREQKRFLETLGLV